MEEVMKIVGDVDSRGRARVQSHNDMPSMTVQSDAHLADIRNILQSFGPAGMAAMLDQTELEYADVSEFTDFHDVMIHAREAEVAFMKLPSKVREIFDHDVSIWLDTAHDEEKRDALVEAGFLEPDKVVPKVVSEEGGTGSGEPAPKETGGAVDGGEAAPGAE